MNKSAHSPEPGNDKPGQSAAGGEPPLIRPERSWRQAPPGFVLPDGRPSGITLSRWSASTVQSPVEVARDAVEEAYVISFAIKPTVMDFVDAHLEVRETSVPPETLLVSAPASDARRGAYHQPYDFLRAYISPRLLEECSGHADGERDARDLPLFPTHFSRDPYLKQLMRCVLNAEAKAVPLDLVFMESVGLALAVRLLRLAADRNPSSGDRAAALTGSRLDRVIEYIQANLAKPIYLADLGNVAGLSQMYFAAQFRAATGSAPYAFILRQRIARAQGLLLNDALSIIDVALSLGFSSQAHFTQAFRKVVGETPHHWRKARRGDAGPGRRDETRGRT